MHRRLLIVLASAAAVVATVPAHAAQDIPASLAGFYYTHAGGMTVRKNGTVTVTYQAYYKRDKGLPSFPRMTLKIGKVRGDIMKGRVIAQTNAKVKVGSHFTIRHRPPGMRLTVKGMKRTIAFCDQTHQEQGACGA